MEAVENEIELMRNLDHPHIVRYLGYKRDEEAGSFYILLEYVSCGSIQALIKTMGGPLDEKVIRKYARQILLGLAYLHSRNPPVIHRDIKGGNVLVETTGNVKLADFGCSKVLSDLVVQNNSVLGTPHWMAPEVIRQDGVSFESVYLLLILMFFSKKGWTCFRHLVFWLHCVGNGNWSASLVAHS